eukprot:907463_1
MPVGETNLFVCRYSLGFTADPSIVIIVCLSVVFICGKVSKTTKDRKAAKAFKMKVNAPKDQEKSGRVQHNEGHGTGQLIGQTPGDVNLLVVRIKLMISRAFVV